MTGLLLAVGACGDRGRPPYEPSVAPAPAAASVAAADGPGARDHLDEPGPDAPCSMRGKCPSDDLTRVSTGLDTAGWARLRQRAETGLVAVRMAGTSVTVDDACSLPGRYAQVQAAADGPARLWSADRLVFVPEEISGCEAATHAVAAFIVDARGAEAIVLPLPCTSTAPGTPSPGCIAVGLDDVERKARATAAFDRASAAANRGDAREALPDLLEVAALVPAGPAYGNLARGLEFLTSTEFGGCRWLADARVAAHTLDASFAVRPDEAQLQPLQHERDDCETRPSLSTCFGDRFVPGEGGNCW